jgi:hypothetical protein
MIDLCSKALGKIGACGIVSFDEGTPEADLAGSFYPVVKARLLSSFPWSFATRSAGLARVAGGGLLGYGACFALPNDFLSVVKVSPGVPYKIASGRLCSNAAAVALTYVADVDEAAMPPVFTSAFVYALAAEFSISLLDDSAKFALFHKLSNTELKEARFLDSAQESPKAMENFSLIDVRK